MLTSRDTASLFIKHDKIVEVESKKLNVSPGLVV